MPFASAIWASGHFGAVLEHQGLALGLGRPEVAFRAADRPGRKGAFMTGQAVFTIASAACAVSPGFWALVGFRCLQAVGAAVLVPASLGLVLTAMPPQGSRQCAGLGG